jgi:hypothetical protein
VIVHAAQAVKKFDVFAKKGKEGWKFDCVVEACSAQEAKMKGMRELGITNPQRVSVYPRR